MYIIIKITEGFGLTFHKKQQNIGKNNIGLTSMIIDAIVQKININGNEEKLR